MTAFVAISRDVEAPDVVIMARLMRSHDVDEAVGLGFLNPEDALNASLENSVVSKSVVSGEGELLAVFGLCLPKVGFAVPWMVATDLLASHPVTMFKTTKAIVSGWAEEFSLYNWVHHANQPAKDFIEVLGFELEATPQVIPGQGTDELFHLFWMGEKPCVS